MKRHTSSDHQKATLLPFPCFSIGFPPNVRAQSNQTETNQIKFKAADQQQPEALTHTEPCWR